MQIVIDIPKEMILSLEQGSFGAKYNMYDLVGCVMKGTPLPKGHGRLIDADALWEKWVFDAIGKQEIDEAPTIIEADERSENK